MEDTTQKLTAKQIEHIAQYLEIFSNAYYIRSGKRLGTVKDVIDLVLGGGFTFEDVFDTYLESVFSDITEDQEDFWLDNIHMFDHVNYFEGGNKNVGGGAWVKIRVQDGFEVHFARKSGRKQRFHEQIESLQKEQIALMNKRLKSLNSPDVKLADLEKNGVEEKVAQMEHKRMELYLRSYINLQPYEVRIARSKSVTEYYLPYQYELVEDVEEFSNAYTNDLPGVSAKMLYTAENRDAVFYLQSRGISKKAAEMMAMLKQTYFRVNMRTAMTAYNDMTRVAMCEISN